MTDVVVGVLALPELVLIVVSAFAGASVAVAGLMLVLDAVDLDDVTAARVPLTDQPACSWASSRSPSSASSCRCAMPAADGWARSECHGRQRTAPESSASPLRLPSSASA